ncbi:MAG: HupE/UreJ family protein [Pseudomonadota bacterium]
MMRLWWRQGAACLLALALVLCALPARAHLMAAGQGTVRLVGDSAYAVIAIPVAAFEGVDDNGDGLLSAGELAAHRAAVSAQVAAMLRFSSAGGEGKVIFEDLLLTHAQEAGVTGESTLVVMRRVQWAAPPTAVRLEARIFGRPGTRGAQLLVRAMLGERSEVGLLTGAQPQYDFFAGPWSTFLKFTRSGGEHILLGADHLLFLLTLLVAGAGWRYWVAVVTSFTLAHSITLACAALGWVELPARLVEPLIAASIVALALDNLIRAPGARRHRPLIVFACGLLHGLGIASVLSNGGLGGDNRVLALVGFNLGVEIGQLAFVLAVLALLHLVRTRLAPPWQARLLTACSVVAAVVGSAWVVSRSMGWS